MEIKYRTWGKGLPPQLIKLQIPGWAGDPDKPADGAKPQPYFCLPWVQGSTYGLELIYPFDTETKVTFDGEKIHFKGDFTQECTWSENPSPPFSNFAPGHYGFTSSLNLIFPEEYILRLEPHPRFFTDLTGECPIAVPGHLHHWWPKIFFVVFKSPRIGEAHIFRKNEPYAQILFVPKKPVYVIEEMNAVEKLQQQQAENNISDLKEFIVKHSWKDHLGNQFDDKYKQMQAAHHQNGIQELISQADQKKKNTRTSKRIGKYVKKVHSAEEQAD